MNGVGRRSVTFSSAAWRLIGGAMHFVYGSRVKVHKDGGLRH